MIYVLKSLFVLLLHTPINGLPLSVIFKQLNAKMEIFASVAVFAFHDLCHIQHHTRQQCLSHVTVSYSSSYKTAVFASCDWVIFNIIQDSSVCLMRLCHIQHHTRQQCLPHVTVTAVSASQSVSKVERVEL